MITTWIFFGFHSQAASWQLSYSIGLSFALFLVAWFWHHRAFSSGDFSLEHTGLIRSISWTRSTKNVGKIGNVGDERKIPGETYGYWSARQAATKASVVICFFICYSTWFDGWLEQLACCWSYCVYTYVTPVWEACCVYSGNGVFAQRGGCEPRLQRTKRCELSVRIGV